MKLNFIQFCTLLACAVMHPPEVTAQSEPLCQGLNVVTSSGSLDLTATDPVVVTGCSNSMDPITRNFAVTATGIDDPDITVQGGWRFRNNSLYESYNVTLPSSSLSAVKAGNTATVSLTSWSLNAIPAGVDEMYATITVLENGSPLTTCRSNLRVVNVTQMPTAPTIVAGTTAICSGGTTNLTATGGSEGSGATYQWRAGNCTTGGVLSTTVDFAAGPASTTTYFVRRAGTGACAGVFTPCAQVTVNVTNPPNAGTVSGNQSICTGGNTTFTSNGNAGGTWSSSNTGVATVVASTGVITGISPGNSTITYTVAGTGGCSNATATRIVSVSLPPNAGTLSGTQTICTAATTTFTSNGNSGGAWSSSNPGVATVGAATGIVTGQTAGIATITYTVTGSGTGGCNTSTATRTITVLPVPTATIQPPSAGQLCQLPGQSISFQNSTSYAGGGATPAVAVAWSTGLQTGSVEIGAPSGQTASALLDLTGAAGVTQPLNITSVAFTTNPTCTNSSGLPTLNIPIKPRPVIPIASADLGGTSNAFCEGYGPAQFAVSSPSGVNWTASYFIEGNQIQTGISVSPFSMNTEIVGSHVLQLTQATYTSGLACDHNPADYGGIFSHERLIKPTPPLPTLLANTPSPLEFCNYTQPLIQDSVARVTQLSTWVDNPQGFDIRWKAAADNAVSNLPLNGALANGSEYFPVFEVNGCQSQFEPSGNPGILVGLMPLPDLTAAPALFPSEICSGNELTLSIPNAAVGNITHFSLWDIQNTANLNASIGNTAGILPNPGISFIISNSTQNSLQWNADLYAQNQNASTANPVTCWSASFGISIEVNPNATFEPTQTEYQVCTNGENFTIDPQWNLIGTGNNNGAFWDTQGFPLPVSIDANNQVLTVLVEDGSATPGIYTLNIAGQYEDSDCADSQTFTVQVLPEPGAEAVIVDIDGTLCHNEYSKVVAVNSQSNYSYEWECVGCSSSSFDGPEFLARWVNPEPGSGTWNALAASYSLTVTDTTTDLRCASTTTYEVEILGDYASCPEGIAWFAPNGLSVVDSPALFFQWYSVEGQNSFSIIPGATDQTYFPGDNVDDCAPARYIVTTSRFIDRCWSTTATCFVDFGLRECDGPKSAASGNYFAAYPNPANGGYLILEELDGIPEARYDIELYSIAGKRIYNERRYVSPLSQSLIRIPEVVSGVYLLRVSNVKFNQSFKIIINN